MDTYLFSFTRDERTIKRIKKEFESNEAALIFLRKIRTEGVEITLNLSTREVYFFDGFDFHDNSFHVSSYSSSYFDVIHLAKVL